MNNLQNIFDEICKSDQRALPLLALVEQALMLSSCLESEHALISELDAIRIAVAVVASRECTSSHDAHVIRRSLESDAASLGSRGGKAKTKAQADARRANGRKGGRPKHYNYMQALERLSELGAIAIATNAYDIAIEDAIAAAHETSLIEECADSFNGPYVVDADSLKVWKLVNGQRESTPTCKGLTK